MSRYESGCPRERQVAHNLQKNNNFYVQSDITNKIDCGTIYDILCPIEEVSLYGKLNRYLEF